MLLFEIYSRIYDNSLVVLPHKFTRDKQKIIKLKTSIQSIKNKRFAKSCSLFCKSKHLVKFSLV